MQPFVDYDPSSELAVRQRHHPSNYASVCAQRNERAETFPVTDPPTPNPNPNPHQCSFLPVVPLDGKGIGAPTNDSPAPAPPREQSELARVILSAMDAVASLPGPKQRRVRTRPARVRHEPGWSHDRFAGDDSSWSPARPGRRARSRSPGWSPQRDRSRSPDWTPQRGRSRSPDWTPRRDRSWSPDRAAAAHRDRSRSPPPRQAGRDRDWSPRATRSRKRSRSRDSERL